MVCLVAPRQIQAQKDAQEALDSARTEMQNSKAQSKDHTDLLSARDAAPSQDEEDRELVRRHLEADAMWKSHQRSELWPRLGPP